MRSHKEILIFLAYTIISLSLAFLGLTSEILTLITVDLLGLTYRDLR